MMTTPSHENQTTTRLLSLRSGGWAILAGLFFALVFFFSFLIQAYNHPSPYVGDRRHPETYGFAFPNGRIPEGLVASGMAKDEMRSLDHPALLTPDEVERIHEEQRWKYLVPSDRVIGVRIDGQARAYPLRVLNWHEISNDTLNNRPIAVTYNPLCDSAVVFSRGLGGEVLEFGVSGLLYNSNLLLFDRRPNGEGESLWSQIQAEAIAGPAVGKQLDILPATLTTWEDWRTRYPDTTVPAPLPEYVARYKRDPYASYFGSDSLKFPVVPTPNSALLPNKTRVAAVGTESVWQVFRYDDIAQKADASGTWKTELGGVPFAFRVVSHDPLVVDVQAPDDHPEADVIYSFWFAWNALRENKVILNEEEGGI